MSVTTKRTALAALCRWTARVIGTLLVLLIVMLGIGEGMPNPFTQPSAVQAGFLALALLLAGILAGWRWELAGGVISLAGWCLFLGQVKDFPRGMNWLIWALALPGVLFLISAFLKCRDKSQT